MGMRIASMAVGFALIGGSVLAGYTETWDDSNNYWFSFDNTVQGGDVDLPHVETGGYDGDGYVQLPLDALTTWDEIPDDTWWGPYTYSDHPGHAVTHPINLNEDPRISVYLREDDQKPVSLGADNGVHFWVGNWDDPDGEGGQDPQLDFWYYNMEFIVDSVWGQPDTMIIDSDPSKWTVLRDDANDIDEPAELFDSPQQWGIGIFGGTVAAPPTGTLEFDHFVNDIPEPSSLALLVLAGLSLTVRRRMHS